MRKIELKLARFAIFSKKILSTYDSHKTILESSNWVLNPTTPQFHRLSSKRVVCHFPISCSFGVYKNIVFQLKRLSPLYIYQAQNPRVAIWPLLKSQGKALLSVGRRVCQWEVVAQLFEFVLNQKYPSKWLKLLKTGQNRKITLFFAY